MHEKAKSYIKMKQLIEDILYGRRKDAATLPLRFVMRFFASVYDFVTFWRNLFYDKRILKIKDVPCRIISVGNIIVGGTGKTPVTIMTAGMLKEEGYSAAFFRVALQLFLCRSPGHPSRP